MATCGHCKARGQTVAHVKTCTGKVGHIQITKAAAAPAPVALVEDDNRAEYELAAAENAADGAAWTEWDDNLRENWAEDLAIAALTRGGFTVRRIG